jgi:hypothetical protein
MKKGLKFVSLSRRKRNFRAAFLFCLTFLSLLGQGAQALELDPFPVYGLSRDLFSVSFFREERPSFYWINVGVPDAFFKGVEPLIFGTIPPNPLVYSVRSVEYGFQASFWCTDQLQIRTTIPFEANAFEDTALNPVTNANITRNLANFGDCELGASYLLVGKREAGNYLAVDGKVRLPTGTNPFKLDFPLLSTGKGASEEAIGLMMGQEVGGFSFFQSIHYEKTQPISVDSSNSLFGPGTFQWPDNVEASGRIEYMVFHRAQRFVSLFYELRFRMSGLMEFNQQPISYAQGQTTDQLFYPMGGAIVRVDKEFSIQGQMGYFPYELNKYRYDANMLFSLQLTYRPL